MSDSKTRLAILIDATELTQAAFAKRAALSVPYLKKLKADSGDNRRMSKKAAIAIAVAFGVDYKWLLGVGAASPISAPFGRTWSKETAAAIEGRKMSKQAREQDACVCFDWFMINVDRLARIIAKGFKDKRAMLCLSRIDSAIGGELMKEFKVPREPMKFAVAEWYSGGKPNALKSPQAVFNQISNRLEKELESEVEQTREPIKKRAK